MASSIASDRRDLAADTVVGFVLITGISLVMITVVMLMGAPALEQVQSRQQVDAMVGSYQRLDRAVSTLLSGAPAGTTPAWQVSMGEGSLSLDDGGQHLWGFVANHERDGNAYGFSFASLADGDAEIEVHNDGPTGIGSDEFQVKATRWEAGDDAAFQWSSKMAFPADSSHTLDFWSWDLEGRATQMELFDLAYSSEKPVAEAWFVDGGAITWTTDAGGSHTRVLYQNTAILTDIDNGQVMHNTPRLRGPESVGSGDDQKVFVRFVKFDGALAAGGRSTSEVLLSSQGSHTRVASTNVDSVQIYPPTGMMTTWERYLDDTVGYDWEEDPGGLGGDEQAATIAAGSNELSATLVETDITLRRTGAS